MLKFKFFTNKKLIHNQAPKYQNICKNTKYINKISPIYIRYRQSAGVNSSVCEVKEYLKTELKRGDDNIIIAEIGNTPVGFIHYETERSTLRRNERICIKALFVDTDYRCMGLGGGLIKQVQYLASEHEIVVKARRSNPASPKLYKNSGFYEDLDYFHFVYRKRQ